MNKEAFPDNNVEPTLVGGIKKWRLTSQGVRALGANIASCHTWYNIRSSSE
jgi:hypothetical protein